METTHHPPKLPRWLQPLLTLIVGLLMAAGIAFGSYELNLYTQQQLYTESQSQLSEILEQIYEKLGNMLDSQWGYLISMDANLQRFQHHNIDTLTDAIGQAESQLSARDSNIQFIALDENGNYYTAEGRAGRVELHRRDRPHPLPPEHPRQRLAEQREPDGLCLQARRSLRAGKHLQ